MHVSISLAKEQPELWQGVVRSWEHEQCSKTTYKGSRTCVVWCTELIGAAFEIASKQPSTPFSLWCEKNGNGIHLNRDNAGSPWPGGQYLPLSAQVSYWKNSNEHTVWLASWPSHKSSLQEGMLPVPL